MSVWVAFPSAAPLGQAALCVRMWQTQGYKVAIAAEDGRTCAADWVWRQATYSGYASAVNLLAKTIMANDGACDWIVAAGDDMFPDPRLRADEIAAQCTEHFNGTLGVMQPWGDSWALPTSEIPQARRVAGSPWLGREWCERANMGRGPLWPEFYHCWADNFLAETAEAMGLLWWREDLSHRHEHYLRHGRPAPEHARHAYDRFDDDQELFVRLKASGFPGSELLP